MSKVIVRNGLPGKLRIEVEGNEDAGFDLDQGMGQLDTLHTLKPWIESLVDAHVADVEKFAADALERTASALAEPLPPPARLPSLRPSKAPKDVA